eukprot:1159369-Pelagomonas_calceolata.AAC.10
MSDDENPNKKARVRKGKSGAYRLGRWVLWEPTSSRLNGPKSPLLDSPTVSTGWLMKGQVKMGSTRQDAACVT